MSELPSREQPPRDQAISVAAISPERPDNHENDWTRRLVLFLRVMAVLSVVKGLYHWAQITGFVGGEDDGFEVQTMAWQTATVYFAVIELVAGDAVGRRGVADDRGVDGGDRTDVPVDLWRQPSRRTRRGSIACRLSRARLDGGARTAAIGHRQPPPQSGGRRHGNENHNKRGRPWTSFIPAAPAAA